MNKVLFVILTIIILVQPLQTIGLWFGILLTVIAVIIVGILWIKPNNKWKSNYKAKSHYLLDSIVLDLLKSYRHDWLNHLQVILGYVSLKKYEQISKYINKINTQAKQRSIISSLTNTKLAIFLLMIPLNYPKLKIELEISETTEAIKKEEIGEQVLSYIKAYIDSIYNVSEETSHNYLFISLSEVAEKLILSIEYEGNINKGYQEIINLGKKLKADGGDLLVDLYSDQEFVTELHFPVILK